MPTAVASVGTDQPITLPGRARPLRQLHAAIVAPTHCVLRGEAGIGKSSLLRLAVRDADAVVVHGVAALAASAYAPLRVVAPTVDLVGEPRTVAQRVLAWLGSDRPFVVDDVQWCDPDTIDVLTELAYLRPFTTVTRPDAGPAAGLVQQLTEAGGVIALEPLTRASARRLANHWRPRAGRRHRARDHRGRGQPARAVRRDGWRDARLECGGGSVACRHLAVRSVDPRARQGCPRWTRCRRAE